MQEIYFIYLFTIYVLPYYIHSNSSYVVKIVIYWQDRYTCNNKFTCIQTDIWLGLNG